MTIERDTVIETILSIVEEQPERNNNGACIYVLDGKPNCVAAAAAERLGLEWERLGEYEGDAVPAAFEMAFPGRFTEEALTLLNTLQSVADGPWDFSKFAFASSAPSEGEGRTPWGECVKQALTIHSSDLEG